MMLLGTTRLLQLVRTTGSKAADAVIAALSERMTPLNVGLVEARFSTRRSDAAYQLDFGALLPPLRLNPDNRADSFDQVTVGFR
jgi:hypothetical protein